jgi:hypothetical protein
VDIPLLITCGDADRDQRCIDRGWRRVDNNIQVILVVKPVNNEHASKEEGSGEDEIEHKGK